jgi:hypothetical protein
MLKFPHIPTRHEPPPAKLSMEEYTRFCLFCLENNPKSQQQTGDVRHCTTRSGPPFRLSP